MSEVRNEIAQLIAQFDRAVNLRDAELFSSLWSDESSWEITGPRPMHVEGKSVIVETWTHMIEGTQWLFRGSFEGVLSVDGDSATGNWPCVERGVFADGTGYDNLAQYEDTYVRENGKWKFKSRKYVYFWLSSEPIPGGPVKN